MPILFDFLKSVGPELFPVPVVDNAVKKLFFKLGNAENQFYSYFDKDIKMIDEKGILNFNGHFPCGSSFKSVEHLRQIILRKEFAMFDKGEAENLKTYG